MEIKTKFQIGDLVKYKYQRGVTEKDGSPIAAVVQYIHTETCSAGTQVFYNLRWLYQIRKSQFSVKENELVDVVPGGQDIMAQKFREDEIVLCSDETRKIVTQEI